jgi:hypothetical protein
MNEPLRKRWLPGRAVVLAVLFGALGMAAVMLLLGPYQSERRTIEDIRRRGGKVDTRYVGPRWLEEQPGELRDLFHRAELVGLSGLKITDADLEQLVGLPQLSIVGLNGTPITDEGLKHLARVSNLKVLTLRDTRVTDAGLKHLAGLPKLEHLTLDETAVTDEGAKQLAKFGSLSALSLNSTQVTDAGVKHLAAMPNLSALSLNSTQVTDEGLEHLAGSRLNYLYMGDTRVTAEGVSRFRKSLPRCVIAK